VDADSAKWRVTQELLDRIKKVRMEKGKDRGMIGFEGGLERLP